MKAGLFIPCYVDAFFPEIGVATLELLERLGVEVAYPLDQTCCGQPMANAGFRDDARPLAENSRDARYSFSKSARMQLRRQSGLWRSSAAGGL